MISIAIISLGICAVTCTIIVCITKYALDKEVRSLSIENKAFKACIDDFCSRFNESYTTPSIWLSYEDDVPYINIDDDCNTENK